MSRSKQREWISCCGRETVWVVSLKLLVSLGEARGKPPIFGPDADSRFQTFLRGEAKKFLAKTKVAIHFITLHPRRSAKSFWCGKNSCNIFPGLFLVSFPPQQWNQVRSPSWGPTTLKFLSGSPWGVWGPNKTQYFEDKYGLFCSLHNMAENKRERFNQ